ncbi:hypothetical protein SSX86_016320 [Deinandra increscens subsp. villosa]|uniref:NB-ARC domain-containing protein n=1 Tax=Deinandra increscens subsp. villosa TaxID=3103831 RepID=A0AAP0D325_9ASTR
MIALCGMGGVGKTTMMEQLKKVVEDSKMFDWVVKLVLGENPDPIAIQQAIAEYVGKDLSETSKNARADRLHKIFEGMSEQGQKKILVIMDDVWKEVNLKDIGLATPLPKGFKLLFTSRSQYVCAQMGVKTSSIFDIRVLEKAEAKTLFFRIVGLCRSEGNDPELQKMGEDIVKKCGGLPIAIITIAKVLNGNIKEAWKETLSNLQNNDLQDLDDIIYKVFEMSYNNLKKDDDKAIFLLSGLFPEDCNIPLEDLMMYGWGLSLFTKVNTLAEARRRVNVCVNNLIRANLLTQSGSMGYVKMHDLVRAFVLSNFSKLKQASIFNHDDMSLQWRIEDAHESYNRILLKCTDMSEFSVDFTKHADLSLLILIDGNRLLKFPKNLYRTMEKLEVVSYQNMYLPSLPVTFVHSTKLRTLCLRSCTLINDDINFIGSLSNLETLSFANCGLRRLPSTIGKLKKLKLLDITGCVSLCIEDGVFQNLESLEELYMRASPGQPIRFTDANCDELEILSSRLFALELELFENKVQSKYVSFKNLERFRISIGCESKYIEKYSFINTLDLVADCNELQECNIMDLFEETEELQLQVKNMNNLEDVSLHHTFSHLRVLHVSMCPILKALVGGINRVGVIGFQKLTFMSLVDLPKMVGLCDDKIELSEMVELRLDGLPIFTSIYSENSNICAPQSLLNEKVVIPKLEKLYISSMESLKQIWPSYISAGNNNICNLKEVTVRRCDSLINLFPTNPLPLLNHLEKLEVEKCSSVEVLFNIDFEHVCEMDGYRTCRLRCISVYGLDKLKELWRIRGGVNGSDILINGFKNVESIEIRFCKGFTNLFTPITANFDLEALTTYNTWKIGKEIDGISKGEITEVDDYIPNVTYPSYLLRKCHRLQYLDLREDKRVGDVVFEIDDQSSKQLEAIQLPLLLPYLEVLKLTFLEETNHVWKCNWKMFTIPQHQPLQLPFQNLSHIILKYSHKIKYLFSPLMAKYLSNLKFVDINRCNGIEEVISSRDDEKEANTTSASSHKNITFFPNLDTLALEFLLCLKSVDGGDIKTNTIQHDQFQISAQVISDSWWFCQCSRKIIICKCDALESLIPWYAVAHMKRLEELEIESCNRMIEVFESKSINYSTSNSNVDEGSASHGAGTTLTSPMLKRTTTVVVPKLFNLKRVSIIGCDFLPHIFTFSTLESLNQLKELKVKKCNAIQVIVKEEKTTSSKVVVFPRLESLQLENLPKLKGFFLGLNDFRFPSLDDVVIDDCPGLIMFTYGESKTKKLKYIRTGFGKRSLEYGLNFQAAFPTCSNDIISKRDVFLFS